MVEKAADENTFNWRLPFYGAIGALAVFLPNLASAADLGAILYLLVAAPIVSLVLIVLAVRKGRRNYLSVLIMFAVYCAISWSLFKNRDALRDIGRWCLWSRSYQAKVLAQPSPSNGELKHLQWDGWGFAGADTSVYLVFDPNDSLAQQLKTHSRGKFTGIPCAVPRITRLQSHWYSVMFYTDTTWDQCH